MERQQREGPEVKVGRRVGLGDKAHVSKWHLASRIHVREYRLGLSAISEEMPQRYRYSSLLGLDGSIVPGEAQPRVYQSCDVLDVRLVSHGHYAFLGLKVGTSWHVGVNVQVDVRVS